MYIGDPRYGSQVPHGSCGVWPFLVAQDGSPEFSMVIHLKMKPCKRMWSQEGPQLSSRRLCDQKISTSTRSTSGATALMEHRRGPEISPCARRLASC